MSDLEVAVREQPTPGHTQDTAPVRVAALEYGDVEPVLAMLGRCSVATRYHRFHGVTDGVSHATKLVANAADGDAYAAWSGDRCVGLASLAVDPDGCASIGVLVEDAWQRHGVGTALTSALAHEARERGVDRLAADVLAENRFILRLLARIGPITSAVGYGGYAVRVALVR
jgi:GNAT superfamily N-acetyltransferase